LNQFAKILDVAGYLPVDTLTNEELANLYPDWSAQKIFEKTGIQTRHIAEIGETASDLAYKAAINLFSQGKISAGEIDFLIFCSQAPDYILPTTACILQNRIGISTQSGALDVNLGCSGYVYSLSLAKGLIESGAATNVLILTADTYSKYINPLDKSVRTLFGDGACATIVAATCSNKPFIGPFIFGTDGSGAHNLIVEGGGFRTPYSDKTKKEYIDSSGNTRSADNLFMNGAEVMSFSLREVPKAVEAILKQAKVKDDDIDYYVLHQANRFMLQTLRKKLKITESKLPIYVEKCGNTVSSSIPFALIEMRKQGKFVHEKQLILVGFGVGYSWAACLLTF
jgi:3-oxoacyl-[acyl-carrier-protein] synthase-3